ncbi:polyphenol oxidase [Caloranaerobacter sp. TR13]|uniref:peptidoglycan editing factor PgeF n=1 Tax=Caloranaerobacter sp. TR13 TaxID=1302151 RepID=UPI0006D4035D|nr:peptidoglycan editing factor PgeF [Caloranaerobacter sp. TR13]KPU28309.1 polyphenol oxidase [Caloranaerobacter sp. TR13]
MEYNKGFTLVSRNDVHYYIIENFEKTGLVKHLFTTRKGGVSPEPYYSLNLGIKTGDEVDNIKKNFLKVFEIIDTCKKNVVFSNQVHGTNIQIVDDEIFTNKINKKGFTYGVDGLITNIKNITLVTFYADCVPIFFLDKGKQVVGLAHAGWRGTVKGIACKMIDVLIEKFNSQLEDILVGIGPSIGQCCFEVGEEVFREFEKVYPDIIDNITQKNSDKYYIDLWETNRLILEKKGILPSNITISGLCTSCNTELFFSYRKENGRTGRMAALIKLI